MALAVLTALLSSACADPDTEVWEGELVAFEASDGIRPCGGTVDQTDRLLRYLDEQWTNGEPSLDPVLVSVSIGELGSLAGHAREGKAEVFVQGALEHELVHLVTLHHDGVSARALTEGIAVAFSGQSVNNGFLVPFAEGAIDPQVLFRGPDDFAYVDYAAAGISAGRLISRWGLPRFRAVYASTRDSDTPEEIRSAFEAEYGEAAFDEHLDQLAELDVACPLQLWECSGEVLEQATLPVVISGGTDSCDDPAFTGFGGPDLDGFKPERRFTIDLDEPSRLHFDNSTNANLQLLRCFESQTECDSIADDNPGAVGLWHLHRSGGTEAEGPGPIYAPGRYIFEVSATDRAREFSVEVRATAAP